MPRGGGDDIECEEDLRNLQGQKKKNKNKKKSEQAVMNQGIIKFDWGFDSVDNIHVLCGDAALAGCMQTHKRSKARCLVLIVEGCHGDRCRLLRLLCLPFILRAGFFFLGCKLIINPLAVF